MTQYCNIGEKAELVFTDQGNEERVVFNEAPIVVTCQPVNPCGRTGAWTLNFTAASGATGTASIAGYEFDTWLFKAVPVVGCLDGNRYDLYFKCNGVERLVYDNFSCTNGAITINSANFSPGAVQPTGLVAKNLDGETLFQRDVTECTFDVLCNDACPPNHLKCKSDEYPGYCCIPCGEITGELRAIKELAKGVG